MNYEKNINKIIKRFGCDIFVIKRDKSIKCSCVDYVTKKADPACPLCLGTGHKIKIKKIKEVVSKDKRSNFNLGNTISDSNVSVYSTYYTKPNILEEDDIIVDRDYIRVVFRIIHLYQESGKNIYDKVLAVDKKSDNAVFLDNFNKIIK